MNDREVETRLRIHHRTCYAYAFPVRFAPHRLVLRPREGHDLRVEEHNLTITPQPQRQWSRDVYGNSILNTHFNQSTSHRELVVESDVLVRRFSSPSPGEYSEPIASTDSFAYDPIELPIVTGYLTPVYPEDADQIQPWLSAVPAFSDFPAAQTFVLEMARLINRSISYKRREEKGVQSPASTLSLGSGSCRDMATLLTESLRHLGIAARFVSGYLDCPATRAARGSTHAWTEFYLPQTGWRGVDPTTGELCGKDHIAVATSQHPRGVMPISGRFIGATNAFLSLTVSVEFQTP